MIVDAHLDLAWNALVTGRDLTRPLDRADGSMTTLPALGAAGVALVCATLFVEPVESWIDDDDGFTGPRYATPHEAEAQALAQVATYEGWVAGGHARLITGRASLADHLARFAEDRVPGLILLMEGADPIVAPEDLSAWWDRGVRMIGLAWGPTRYAGGTGSSAGLSPAGAELLHAMAERGVIHDTSHLSEEAFAAAAELRHHAVCLTHVAARALQERPGRSPRIPLNRFASDAQLRTVARAGGVIGLALLNDFLDPGWTPATARDTPVRVGGQVAAHLAHIAGVTGWEHVGIGSDVDAGHGRDATPAELDSVRDWERIGDAVPETARAGVLGGNWLRFLRDALPED